MSGPMRFTEPGDDYDFYFSGHMALACFGGPHHGEFSKEQPKGYRPAIETITNAGTEFVQFIWLVDLETEQDPEEEQ